MLRESPSLCMLILSFKNSKRVRQHLFFDSIEGRDDKEACRTISIIQGRPTLQNISNLANHRHHLFNLTSKFAAAVVAQCLVFYECVLGIHLGRSYFQPQSYKLITTKVPPKMSDALSIIRQKVALFSRKHHLRRSSIETSVSQTLCNKKYDGFLLKHVV